MFNSKRNTKSIQTQVIVASETLKNTYDTSSSSIQKPIIYNINDTLPYLADFDLEKKVLKITSDEFLSGTFDNRIHIFFITNATQENINDIMGKIQETNGNISECFVIVEKEDELAQIQQHQQYVQERSLSENTTSLQSDIDDNISNLKKLAPKTLEQFGKQELKQPNNSFLISKGLPQHIRKFYKDIYQISNCSPVEIFFKGRLKNVFAGKITDDNPGIVENINVKVGKHLEIEDGTDKNYYIIPLCDISVYETKEREPQNLLNLIGKFQYRLMEKSPSIISKVIMTTGGQETCAAGTDFLNYLKGYQLCFDQAFRMVLKDILLPSYSLTQIPILVKNLDNLSYISVVARELIGGPVASKYNEYLENKEGLEKQITVNQNALRDDESLTELRESLTELRESINKNKTTLTETENDFKNLGVKAKQKIDALHDIFNSYDDPSKKLLMEKISYAKILEYEYNRQ